MSVSEMESHVPVQDMESYMSVSEMESNMSVSEIESHTSVSEMETLLSFGLGFCKTLSQETVYKFEEMVREALDVSG